MPKDQADTRTEIIKAARNQFLLHGYEGARLQKVADNIGVTKAMIHYYFNTKKELFERVFIQSIVQIFGQLPEILEKDIPLFKKIEELIEHCLQVAEQYPRVISFVVTESGRKAEWLAPLFEEQVQLTVAGFDRELEKAAADYQIASVDARELLLNIFSLCYYPVLSAPMNRALLNRKDSAGEGAGFGHRKGVVLDTILNWLTA